MFTKIYRMFIFTLGAIIFHISHFIFTIMYYGTLWISHTLPSTENTMGFAHANSPHNIHPLERNRENDEL